MQAQQPLRLDGAQAAGVVDGAAGDDQQQQEEEAEQQEERDESELVTFPAVVRLQAVDGARHLEKALAMHTDHQLLERSDKRTHTLSSLLFRAGTFRFLLTFAFLFLVPLLHTKAFLFLLATLLHMFLLVNRWISYALRFAYFLNHCWSGTLRFHQVL